MSRDLILTLIKLSLLGAIALLLVILIWQGNEVEQRVLDVQGTVTERTEKLAGGVATLDGRTEKLAREVEKIGALDERTQKLAESVEKLRAEGVRIVPAPDSGIAHPPATGSTGGPGAPAATGTSEVPGAVDPRTLPYWPTPDNILSDLSEEPVPPADAPHGGIIRYYTGANPTSLNVHVNNDAELQERICAPVYEYLADQSRTDPDRWIPSLCNRVTVNKDFTEFTCYLRKGVYWHKPFVTEEEKRGGLKWLDDLPPQEVTADDVKFTFDTVCNPLSECGSEQSYLVDLDEVEIVDRYTVKVKWKRSLYYNKGTTLNLLMIFPKFIYGRAEDGKELPEELVAPTFPQHWFNHKMCGTGPFRFAGFEEGQIIRLRRNDGWWNPVKPAIDGIDLRIVTEPAVQLAMFKAGDIDVYSSYPNDYRAEILEGGPGSVKEMEAEGKVTVKKWEMFTYYFIGWNLRLPQLREREVRQALAHLYPKERVIRDIYYGLAVPHDSPVHHWENCYDKNLPQFPYDPAAAARLLDQAGWKLNDHGVREKVVDGEKRELRIRLLYPAQSPVARDTTLLYQKSAQEAGVLIEPFGREWSVMEKMLEDKDFDAAMLGWGNSWDSDPSQIWASESAKSAKGSNFVSYMNPEIDTIIEDLKTTFDPAKRQELWRRFQEIIVNDQPYCFTHIRTRVWFINNRLGNQYFAKLRPQDWFYPWFVKNAK